MPRKLSLKRETLTELTASDLTRVAGAGADGPTSNCTLPVNQCILSLNPCYYTEYPSCHTASVAICA